MFDDEEDTEETWWVIPHWSSLDYCEVTITSGPDKLGRVFVTGTRSHGWNADRATIKTRVPRDKLTRTPSYIEAFKDLYDDPCQPERKSY